MIVPSQNPVLCRFPDHERHPVGKVLLATSPTSDAFSGEEIAFGLCVPPHTPHALCSSMPTWKDNVAFMEREKWAMDAMKVGYPRFIVHESVGKLTELCEQRLSAAGERCNLFPSMRTAECCREFLVNQSTKAGSPLHVRLARFPIPQKQGAATATKGCSLVTEIYATLFPAHALPLAKQFWQNVGMGISSRLAEYCLALLLDKSLPPANVTGSLIVRDNIPPSCVETALVSAVEHPNSNHVATITDHQDVRSEDEPISGAAAKQAIRTRIAGLLQRRQSNQTASAVEVTADDVFLYLTGMCAIWNAHHIASKAHPTAKTVCFGFSYADTIKILKNWGPGCHFFGHGSDMDFDELQMIIEAELSVSPSTPPITALFVEFPSNPLLRSPDLARLRALADKYDFLIIIDESIGNFVNVDVLPYADILATSLSKVFSGAANVTGGSLVINPAGRHYQELKRKMRSSFEDIYFDEDAIYMERNSRDLHTRVSITNLNAEAVCDFLHSRSIASGAPLSVIKEVCYPKWMTRERYDRCRATGKHSNGVNGGFGGLFSIIFTTATACRVFFDSLSCYKGPTFGTNFTIAFPYTVLAHYTERDWVAQYGVEENLVRISVGMEDREALLRCVSTALLLAEQAT